MSGKSFSRRGFIQGGTTALAGQAFLPRRVNVHAPAWPRRSASASDTLAERVDPSIMKSLALRAIDAAKAAGAQYADVRLTRTCQQGMGKTNSIHLIVDNEVFGVGVRCMVNGYWGFAASPVWDPDEVVTLARRAAATARSNAKGSARPIDWSPQPAVTGEWTTPLKIDPFTVSLEEKLDWVDATAHTMGRFQVVNHSRYTGHDYEVGIYETINCWRQEGALATTDGSYVSQTRFRTKLPDVFHANFPPIFRPCLGVHPSGWGWEGAREVDYLGQLPEAIKQMDFYANLPGRDVEIGRYDVVLDGWTAADLVEATLGAATELDRALGYEANATGTSYLGPDPMALLGTYQVGSPLLNVTATRSLPRGLSTVQWDAEGLTPETVPLVKDGVLVDYQTTREQAAWLAPYYAKVGRPVRSHGHAGAASALDVTQQQRADILVEPGQPGIPVEEMIKGIKKGMYVFWGTVGMDVDFQAKTGLFQGMAQREIVNGRLGPKIGGRIMFNSTELWKNLFAVGPKTEAQGWDYYRKKGEPEQQMYFTVQTPPLHFKNVTVIR